MVESALSHPQNLAAHGEPDAAALAAAYALALARNHGFSDGNKRTAWVVARLFLRLNGITLKLNPVDAVILMRGVAGGKVSEAGLAAWFRERMV